MAFEINPEFKLFENEILSIFNNFEDKGMNYIVGERNTLKTFELVDQKINVKSFKIPSFFKSIIYKFFRKSKAERSFLHAEILLQKGIGTPQPIAFQTNFNALGLKKSYYACIHQNYDLTFRELIEIEDYPDRENILRQFARFCFKMHEAGVEFKDHSPGNTLIENGKAGEYHFYLVDLNRMKFHAVMDTELRMKNMAKLASKSDMTRIICDEYAKCSGDNPNQLFELMQSNTLRVISSMHRRENAKRKFKTIIQNK
ncbi:MAG: lipopolysaccharide kinase InaA family protein [Weeksellaceae bacterium]